MEEETDEFEAVEGFVHSVEIPVGTPTKIAVAVLLIHLYAVRDMNDREYALYKSAMDATQRYLEGEHRYDE